MNARDDVKKSFYYGLAARLVLAAVQERFAARVDFLVAQWLQRCSTKIEAAQRVFRSEQKPVRWISPA